MSGAAVAARGAGPLDVRDLGRMPYRLCWVLQKELVEQRLAGRAPDTLLLVEHEPVVTLGRGTRGAFLAGGARVLREGDAEFVELPGGARGGHRGRARRAGHVPRAGAARRVSDREAARGAA